MFLEILRHGCLGPVGFGTSGFAWIENSVEIGYFEFIVFDLYVEVWSEVLHGLFVAVRGGVSSDEDGLRSLAIGHFLQLLVILVELLLRLEVLLEDFVADGHDAFAFFLFLAFDQVFNRVRVCDGLRFEELCFQRLCLAHGFKAHGPARHCSNVGIRRGT